MNAKMQNVADSFEACLKMLQERISTLPEGNHTIAIDGRSAAGKTTLAMLLAKELGARVVHMDDFFLPVELRTKERLAEPGGNVHYERIKEEVLPFLNSGQAFSYMRFDCGVMELKGCCELAPAPFTIVEGAYSCHPALGNYMSLKVFLDVDSEIQMARIKERNGKEKAENFKNKWIPMEEAYFSAFHIEEWADLIIKV